MDRELIRKARQTNLADFLLSAGVPLVRNGRRYRHKEHDSLIFTDNAFCWNAKSDKGNAIDYLMRHMGYEFKDAVFALTRNTPADGRGRDSKKNIHTAFKFDIEGMNTNTDKVRRYLVDTRHINHALINQLVKSGLIHQEIKTNNAYFKMIDERGKCVGAERQGITSKRFKGIAEGSKYGYGFNVRFSDDGIFDYALFFESAVDLISFIDFKTLHEKKPLDRCILVSMAGLKINIIKHTIKAFAGNPRAVLCVDNDEAGRHFIATVKTAGMDYGLRLPDEQYSDWNEQLSKTKQLCTPIGRFLDRAEKSI